MRVSLRIVRDRNPVCKDTSDTSGKHPADVRRLVLVALIASALAVGCVRDIVQWDREERAPGVIAPGARLTIQPGNQPALMAPWTPPTVPTDAPSGALRCTATLSATTARGDTAFAAWWRPRPDSTAALVVARSTDGGQSWAAAVIADSTDRGRCGCRRPAPFISADSLNGFVHVVYYMVAAEGAGVFFVHSMEGGDMFHSPVAIVYGERISAAAVASRGDTVAVAYENPNADSPQIWLALSKTAGHIFERRQAVSPGTSVESRPAVAVRNGRVAVAWFDTERGGGNAATVLRMGTPRW
jgi:hypothetical protein